MLNVKKKLYFHWKFAVQCTIFAQMCKCTQQLIIPQLSPSGKKLFQTPSKFSINWKRKLIGIVLSHKILVEKKNINLLNVFIIVYGKVKSWEAHLIKWNVSYYFQMLVTSNSNRFYETFFGYNGTMLSSASERYSYYNLVSISVWTKFFFCVQIQIFVIKKESGKTKNEKIIYLK